MTGPSDRAVEAAWECASTEDGTLNVSAILKAAHDPALGEDASVCIGDVLDWLRREWVGGDRIADRLRVQHREGRL